MRVELDVDIEDIASSLRTDRDMAFLLIKRIDLSIAEYEFTEDLVVSLIECMKSDVTDQEPLDEAIRLIKSCDG